MKFLALRRSSYFKVIIKRLIKVKLGRPKNGSLLKQKLEKRKFIEISAAKIDINRTRRAKI